jgi:hypothetical protein
MTDEDKEDEVGIPFPAAGNALTKAAHSGPGKALLTPAAKVFGEYFGWRAKEITDGWKRQREKNLETHAGKVLEKEGTPIPREPTEKQVILVSEWIERAQEVDPDDPEISALWQSLLGAIYRKETDAKEWLEVIKQLNESEARLLLRIPGVFQPVNSREHTQATKLASLGLLESFHWSRFANWRKPEILLALIGLVVAAVFSSVPEAVLFQVVAGVFAKPIAIGIATLFTAIAVIRLVGTYLREINEYRITDLGRDLRRSAWRYLGKQPGVAESEAKTSTEAEPEAEPTPKENKPKRHRQKAADTKIE